MVKTAAGILAAVFVLQSSAFAQHAHGGSAAKPAVLLPGLGAHRMPVANLSEEGQKFFDQGLAMLYGFNRFESVRSFQQAAKLGPKALMPAVGVALAQGPHINMDLDGDVDMKAYCAGLTVAAKSRAMAPMWEQAWFDAVQARCPAGADATQFSSAMKHLTEQYPDDLDAFTIYAESLMIPPRWRWFSRDGKAAAGVDEAIGVLETVLRRNPEHPGANHLYIHAVESSSRPERAIPSAQRLMGIVPAAGHIVHMPGHIWMVLGDFEMVAATNERAVQVDREYFEKTGLFGHTYTGYFIHNLHFIAVARQMQGVTSKALAAAEEVAGHASKMTGEMAMMADAFVPVPLTVLLRGQKYDEVLKYPRPAKEFLSATAMWHYARALAFAAKGDQAGASVEAGQFKTAKSALPAKWLWLNNEASEVLAVAEQALQARLAASPADSLSYWKKAVELQDSLVYDEPPAFYYPVRESLGGALLRAGKPVEAEAVFREALVKSPRNGRLLFGLWESLKAQGKNDGAQLVQREFASAWKRSEITLRVADL